MSKARTWGTRGRPVIITGTAAAILPTPHRATRGANARTSIEEASMESDRDIEGYIFGDEFDAEMFSPAQITDLLAAYFIDCAEEYAEALL
jgi:hypothetical protein